MKKTILPLFFVSFFCGVQAQTNFTQANAAPPPPPPIGTKYQHLNPIGPRYQWEANGGYCGEVSMNEACLYYGQYVSQYDMRQIASGKQGSAYQLLLGNNDKSTADQLRLKSEVLDTNNTTAFLLWVKKHVMMGHPVIIGVMNNEFLFYDSLNPQSGQPNYDHIVTVAGWGSNYDLYDGLYHTDDVVYIEDHGVYSQDTTFISVPDNTVQYWFPVPISYLLGNRILANSQTDSNRIYTLLELSNPQQDTLLNYGIAILGIKDDANETLPIRLATNINYQSPEIDKHTQKNPDGDSIMISMTVSGLTPGKHYVIYQYKDQKNIPTSNFNANSGSYWMHFKAQTTVWTYSFKVKDNEKYFYRAVLKSGN